MSDTERKIVQYMRMYGSITDEDARNMRYSNRLGARIYDIRQKGIDIIALFEKNTHNSGQHARYSLAQSEANNKLLKEYGYIE